MRTTVEIDSTILERAKRHASTAGKTLGAVVTDALAAYLASVSSDRDEPFELIVRGRKGARFPSPAEVARVEADEEMASLRLGRRRRRAAS